MVSTLSLISLAAPYRASADGSAVLDEATGLVWSRCALGQTWNGRGCTGTALKYLFSELEQTTIDFNSNGGLAGFKDWVVPTAKQLAFLRKCNKGFSAITKNLQDGETLSKECSDGSVYPTIDSNIFPDTPSSSFWSSSPSVDDANKYSWAVSFHSGHVDDVAKNNTMFVRLVRAGQLSGSKDALFFTVRLKEMNQADNTSAIKVVEAQKRREKAVLDELYPHGRPVRQGSQTCEAQKQTCKASCGPITYWNGRSYVDNPKYNSCDYQCSRISCN